MIFSGMVSNLKEIILSLLNIAEDKEVQSELPRVKAHARDLRQQIEGDNAEGIEMSLVRLYSYLHSAGCYYTEQERGVLRMRNSYGCYPGGFAPLIKAGPYIKPETVVADLGSGNGLQGLLLQSLYPHKRTIQVEISSEMIRMGRIFQKALGIDRERVEWINDDIQNVLLSAIDFLYIYLPARPSGEGLRLYREIAQKLLSGNKPMYIFSVADSLREFIKEEFTVFYSDGHLTCMKRQQGD
jgi:hypothetical protein